MADGTISGGCSHGMKLLVSALALCQSDKSITERHLDVASLLQSMNRTDSKIHHERIASMSTHKKEQKMKNKNAKKEIVRVESERS